MISGMEKAAVDHEALLDTYIRAINIITEGRPQDLTISVHMCRGNYKVNCISQLSIDFSHKLGYFRVACTFPKEDTIG